MDTTYLSKEEIAVNDSILVTCKFCDAKFVPFNPADDSCECDGCYIIRKQEEIGIMELHVTRHPWFGWEVMKKDWDLGDIIASGKTIPSAIDDFFEQLTMKHDIEAKYLQHQYTWS